MLHIASEKQLKSFSYYADSKEELFEKIKQTLSELESQEGVTEVEKITDKIGPYTDDNSVKKYFAQVSFIITKKRPIGSKKNLNVSNKANKTKSNGFER